MVNHLALLLVFFVYTGYCTLATGAGLPQAVAFAAAAPVAVPVVATLGRNSALAALKTLARLRVEQSLRLSRRASLKPPPPQAPPSVINNQDQDVIVL
jgi:hypothetical protein